MSSASSSAGLPPPTSEAELDKARVDAMNALVGVLQGNTRVRFEVNIEELMNAVGPSLSDKASARARATAYRLLRHTIVDKDSVEKLLDQSLDWYIVKYVTSFSH